MAWPTGNVSVANLDSGSDSISSARADLYEAVTKLNVLINEGTTGFVDLVSNQTIGGDKTFTGNTTFNEYKETVYSIGTTSGSVTPNAYNGPVQTITLNGALTLNAPTGMTSGSSLSLIIRQDSTGSRVMTANSLYKFSGGYKTLSTISNGIDMINIFYDGTNYLSGLSRGFS